VSNRNLPKAFQDLPAFAFGDNPELANKLASLVMTGVKTATCGALWQYEAEGVPVSKVGAREIVLDGAKNPLCVIEYAEVFISPFNAVDAKFAYDEGEGDRSYAYWRETHERYFRRQGPFSEDMPVVCYRFRMIAKFELEGASR
jgi:uncharacterized protein YhfF